MESNQRRDFSLYGLAIRCIAALPTFLKMAEAVGVEPTRDYKSHHGFQDR